MLSLTITLILYLYSTSTIYPLHSTFHILLHTALGDKKYHMALISAHDLELVVNFCQCYG